MARPRTCPHCKRSIPVRKGYKFDDSMNMVCNQCGGIVFPANKESEDVLKDKKRKGPTTTTYGRTGHGQWPHHYQSYGVHGAHRTAHGAAKPGGNVTADY